MKVARMRVWMAVFVALVFVCGLALGLGAGLWAGTRANVRALVPPPAPLGPRQARGPRFATERILERLERDAPDFTVTQRAQLEALFETRRQAFEQVAREMRERYAAEQRQLRAHVAEILTPEQMETFDSARRWRRGPRGRPGSPRDEPRGDR